MEEYDLDYDKTLDTYNLCEKYVGSMSVDEPTKKKI